MLAMSHPQHQPNSMGYAPTSSAPGALPLPGGLEGLNPYHPLAFWPHPMYMGQQQGMGQGVVLPRPHLLGSNAKEQHPGPLGEEAAELGQAQDGSPVPGSRGAKASTYAARHQASEKRRRTRINDRLQQLRDVVPTPQEGSNTGDFLGHVLTYVTQLQALAGVQPKQPLPTSGSGSGAPPPAAVVDAATPAGAKAAAGNPRGTEAVDVPPAAGGTRLKRGRTRKGT